jgi:hypothetical protein
MSAGGEDRMSTLERRCRLLLRLYPVAYRSERGEEILGTLLEATPEVRTWPLPRDIRGLAIGGLRARAAINGRNTMAANLRVAVLVGVAAYLAYDVAGYLGALVLVVSIAWLAIDARPAIAMVAILLGIWRPAAINNLATGILSELPFLGICAAVAAPALWLLHRQSAHAGPPTQT